MCKKMLLFYAIYLQKKLVRTWLHVFVLTNKDIISSSYHSRKFLLYKCKNIGDVCKWST